MNKLIMFFILGMFLISLVSAFGETANVDNKLKEGLTISESASKYDAVNIKGFWDWLPFVEDNKADLVLTGHDESCGVDCISEFQITTYQDSALVEDIKFLKLEGENWIDSNIRSYQFYIKTNEEEFSVDDYENKCEVIGHDEKNGSEIIECNYIMIGSHIEKKPLWEEYNIGDELRAGTYIVKLEGQKRADWTYDWQITTQGKLISEWATWGSTTLTTNLVSYYNLDESSGNALDALGLNNLTNKNTVTNTTGKILSGKAFNGVNQYYNTSSMTDIPVGTSARTFNVWVYSRDISDYGDIITYGDELTNQLFHWRHLNNGTIWFQSQGTAANTLQSNGTISNNTWYMETISFDGTTVKMYQNGVLTGSKNIALNTGTVAKMKVGIYVDGIQEPFNGTIDEIGIWSRALTQAEITELYNSGSGVAYPFINGVVTLNSPANNSIQTSTTVTTNASATITGGATLVNATLYDNSTGTWGTRNVTSISTTRNENSGILMVETYTPAIGKHGMKIYSNYNQYLLGVEKNVSDTATKAYLLDSGKNVLASADFVGAIANFTTTVMNASTYYYVAVDNSGGAFLSYRKNTGASYPVTGTNINYVGGLNNGVDDATGAYDVVSVSSSGGGYTSYTTSINNTYPTGSSIKWNYQFCDSDGACGFATSNYTFGIDSTAPTITVVAPPSLISYGYNGQNTTLSYQVTDAGLNSCWFNYNGTNVTAPCTSGILNTTYFTISNTKKNLTFYANDTAGNINSSFVSWDYKIFENSQTYSTTTTEGASESFSINITMLNSTYRISTGNLNYDGVNYSATLTIDGYNYLLRSLTIPDVTSTTNKTFYWIITLDNGTVITTAALNQTVGNLGIDDCSVYTNKLFNLTMYDEDNRALINATTSNTSIKITFNIKSLSGLSLLNYSTLSSRVNPSRVCLQNPLGSSVYRLDGVIEYKSIGRFQEYYHLQNYSLSNSTNNVNISLYDLDNSTGTEFKITYKDSDFIAVVGAILDIQRSYIENGTFVTVERVLTGSSGYTIGHLVRNDAIYNILVYKEGVLLATFENVVADCQNPLLSSCDINLNSYGSSSLVSDFTNYKDMTFTINFNKTTRVVSSIFSIVSGATKTVSLNVTLFDNLGNTSVCNDVLFSSGGQLSCTVPSNFGNATIVATVYKDGEYMGRAIIKIKQDAEDIYGNNLILIAMLIFLMFAGLGMGSDSPMFMGIMLAIGSIILIALNIIYSPSIIGVGATILWFIIAIVLVLIKGANRP